MGVLFFKIRIAVGTIKKYTYFNIAVYLLPFSPHNWWLSYEIIIADRQMRNLTKPIKEVTLKNQVAEVTASLSLTLKIDDILCFFPLLQHGFIMKTQVGCSIKTLLCKHLGLNPEYVEDRIKTIFLDGKPVDDIGSAIVKDGSTLALSAAMPGLVGATLRKGGRYAPMRRQISHFKNAKPSTIREGVLILKLFNLLAKEQGPIFLKKGIWVKGKDLQDFLKRQSNCFWGRCKAAKVDGEKFDLEKLQKIEWKDKEVFLQIRTF